MAVMVYTRSLLLKLCLSKNKNVGVPVYNFNIRHQSQCEKRQLEMLSPKFELQSEERNPTSDLDLPMLHPQKKERRQGYVHAVYQSIDATDRGVYRIH